VRADVPLAAKLLRIRHHLFFENFIALIQENEIMGSKI